MKNGLDEMFSEYRLCSRTVAEENPNDSIYQYTNKCGEPDPWMSMSQRNTRPHLLPGTYVYKTRANQPETKEKVMNNRTLDADNINTSIHQLAHLILHNGWSIFGGYVRDMLAGNEPHDLDIFATAADIPKLLSVVVSDRYRMTHISQSTYHPKGWKVEIEELGEASNRLNLDIVNPGIGHSPDVDVNRLVLSAGGIWVMGGYSYDFGTIHQHIKERVFVPEFACSARRKAKLITFGWTAMR